MAVKNYPIGDYLIQLKNASMAGKREVVVSKTKLLVSVSETLKKLGFLEDFSIDEKNLTARLSYHKKESLLTNVKLISKPGLRIYANVDEIASHKGVSDLIISTPKGVMSSKEALKNAVGGELIAEIW